jgi:conjugative relaxase-like TrwC/TraI family protein
MLTIKALGKYGEGGSSRVGYMLGQAETRQPDYYLKGEEGVGEPAGRWHGRAAAHIGLTGNVMPHQLHGLMQGFDPRTYDPVSPDNTGLVQRPGKDNRAGVDCTFVCPKSVSLVWALETPANRKRIEAAFHEAVNTALGRLEQEVVTRRNHGGKDAEPVEGLFIAVFEHGTARVPRMEDGQEPTADCHLHAHCLISNVCLRKDGTCGTIVNDSLYDNQKLLGAMFRGALCESLRKLGYHIEAGKSDTFEIAGIGEHLRDAFSKRNKRLHEWLAQHRDELAAKGITGKKAEDYAWARTRSAKDSVNRPALFREWQEEAARSWDFDASKLEGIKGSVAGLFHHPPPVNVDGILARLTGGESVFALKDIETELWCARQHYDFDVRKVLRNVLDSDQVVLLRDTHGKLFLTTKELHDKEQEIARLTVGGQHDARHHTGAARTDEVMNAFAATQRTKGAAEGWTFDEQIWVKQREAVAHLTTQSGQFAILKGYAGAGKTTVMRCVQEVYADHGFNVMGAALAGKAAENLEREAGIRSDTLLGLLTRIGHGHLQLTAKDVVVVDEAGMVDSCLMHGIVSACDKAGAKLVLLGEAEQLQAVSAGGAFRMMERLLAEKAMDGKGIAILDDITRQQDDYKWLTQVVLDVRRGDAGTALKALAEHDLLRTGKDADEVKEAMVGDWFADTAGYRTKLMIAGTRAETGDLNAMAREQRRAAGELKGRDVLIDVCPRDGAATVAKSFAVGDRIVFGRKEKKLGIEEASVQNGHYGTIEKLKPAVLGQSAVLTVRLDDGRRITFDTASKVEYVPRGLRKYSDGDLFRTSCYNAIDHAYAITVHKSQGQTVDRCYVLASDRMTDREWGYVALSRSRGATTLYATEDQQADLAAKLSRSRLKGTSLDYDAIDKADFRSDGADFDLDALIESVPKGRFDKKIDTLTQAITWGGAEDINVMLADPQRRTGLNAADDDGNTPLHLACYKKNREAVVALLDAGAAVEAGNRMGITPLMDAVRAGDTDIVAVLVDRGADPFRAAKSGDTPFRFASDLERRAGKTVELAAARADKLRQVIEKAMDDARLTALRRDLASAEVAFHDAAKVRRAASEMLAAFYRGREISLDQASRRGSEATFRTNLSDPAASTGVRADKGQGSTQTQVAKGRAREMEPER